MEKFEKLAIKDIRTNPFQPRKVFDQEKLEEFRRKQPKSHNYLLEGLKNFNQD